MYLHINTVDRPPVDTASFSEGAMMGICVPSMHPTTFGNPEGNS